MQRLWFAFAFCLSAAVAVYMFTPRGEAWDRYDQGLGINATWPVAPQKHENGPLVELRLFRGPSEAAERGGPPTFDRDQYLSVGVATFPDEKASIQYEDSRLVQPGEEARVTTLPDGGHEVAQRGSVTRVWRRGSKVYVAEAGGRLTPRELKTFLDSVQL